MSRTKYLRRQWTCPKCARTFTVEGACYMASSSASVSAQLSSKLMRMRIHHKQTGCKSDNLTSNFATTAGAAATGLYMLSKLFS
jgi:hypothetical protein